MQVVRAKLEALDKAGSFQAWLRIGRALVIGKTHALKVTGANAPWGQNYSHVFGECMQQHGFASLRASARSYAIVLAEHEAEITAWRESLPEKRRRRLNDPLAVVRRCKTSVQASDDARSPDDWRRDAQAAAKRLLMCLEHLPGDEASTLWTAVQDRVAVRTGRNEYVPA